MNYGNYDAWKSTDPRDAEYQEPDDEPTEDDIAEMEQREQQDKDAA